MLNVRNKSPQPATARYPSKYPPVGPRSVPMPLVNPEKTGRPAIPNSRYIPAHRVPVFAPRRTLVNKMPNSPSEIGTGLKGTAMDNGPSMQVMDVIRPAIAFL